MLTCKNCGGPLTAQELYLKDPDAFFRLDFSVYTFCSEQCSNKYSKDKSVRENPEEIERVSPISEVGLSGKGIGRSSVKPKLPIEKAPNQKPIQPVESPPSMKEVSSTLIPWHKVILLSVVLFIINYLWFNQWLVVGSVVGGIFVILLILIDKEELAERSKKIKKKQLRIYTDKKIDLNLTFPSYCLLGLYELVGDNRRKLQTFESLIYTSCFVSNEKLYVHEVDLNLMKNCRDTDHLYYNSEEDKGVVLEIHRVNILNVRFIDSRRSTEELLGDMIKDKLMEGLASLIGSRSVPQTVHMDAMVELYYYASSQKIGTILLGIPEKLVGSVNFDWGSLIPEGVNPLPDWVADVYEGGSILLGDSPKNQKESKAVETAKLLAETLAKLKLSRSAR